MRFIYLISNFQTSKIHSLSLHIVVPSLDLTIVCTCVSLWEFNNGMLMQHSVAQSSLDIKGNELTLFLTIAEYGDFMIE
jgi:hypothetical protein